MATGDPSDIAQRLRGLLPPSWFGTGLVQIDSRQQLSETPVLDTVLAGTAYPLSWDYTLFQYVLLQSRIATATGFNLDKISYDFCGTRLPRLTNEHDTAYRARIVAEILRPRQTRAAIVKMLKDLTGNAPQVIELWNSGDVGEYNTGPGCQGYGVAGMYGSLQFRNQVFVTAYRPAGEGIPTIGGYGNPASGYGSTGHGEYTDLTTMWVGKVKDSDIYAATAGIVAAGITAWTAIRSNPNTVDAPTMYFGNFSNTDNLALVSSYFF